ncbi:ArsR/SmtB family transcription factor [Xenorhabdus eapokensis]|uniref:Nodulation protein NOLR n=1 Tax=Xenorhabdus eapokensis TaxID=1873482 RepID=A0A1Q5TYI0_9GAMM|nr:helix-turn-helix domain-containing protein [Xenorhabdus eapokensis]OKP04781.1 nodulation protein NOLR [Xenorhabdus eapokensis]OKP05276.1 nodulation protein NOLR [Xenorhabdus eapokensis]
MKHEEVAASLAELGNSHRLAIFRFLVKAGHQGASVGEIQKALDIPPSTLSHHLNRMVKVGLIRQAKHSRTIVCIPDYQHLGNLINFLQEECCVGI